MLAAISIIAVATTIIVWYKLAQVERDLNNITGALMKKGLICEEEI